MRIGNVRYVFRKLEEIEIFGSLHQRDVEVTTASQRVDQGWSWKNFEYKREELSHLARDLVPTCSLTHLKSIQCIHNYVSSLLESFKLKPKQSMIFNVTELIQTEEENFETPLEFRPERFLDPLNEKSPKNRHPFAYIPFRIVLVSYSYVFPRY